jgi:hypothetical protein
MSCGGSLDPDRPVHKHSHRNSWRKCCVILHLPISPVPPKLEENEMPESARKTAAAIKERAIKKIDMADLPAQRRQSG